MVALQAEVGITADTRASIDLPALLNRLKQPLSPEDQPKAINPKAYNATNDESHQLIIHSADPNAFSQTQPINAGDVKRSIQRREFPQQRRSLEADDVRDMLDWVRRQKKAEIAKASNGNTDAFNSKRSADYSQKFVRDFVTNMQNLNRIGGVENGVSRIQYERSRRNANTKQRRSINRRRSYHSDREFLNT